MTRWNEKYHDKYKAYSLYGKMLIPERHEEAWKKVRANLGSPGIDEVTIGMFEKQKDKHIETIIRKLRNKEYQPEPVKRVEIDKLGSNKKRPLGIPTVKDRLIQQVLKELLEPIFDPNFSEHSYGYRPNKSAHAAVKQAEKYRKQSHWVIDADIKGFFDNVDHEILLDIVNEKVSDGSILKLIRKFLEAGVLKDGEFMETTVGTPQGGVISPLLANIYLHHLDRRLEERGYRFVRYADDFLVFCNTKEEAEHGLQFIKQVLKEELKLDLNMDKTSIAYISYKRYEKEKERPERKDINFLGFRINRYHTVPRKRSVERFKEKIRQETKRSWTRDIKGMMSSINKKIRGWGNYYKHGSVKTLFSELDAWIRTRIRLNLGKRKVKNFKLNKHYMSISNYKYTNRDLREMGLKSLSLMKENTPAP